MTGFPDSMSVFKKALQEGQIIQAYQGLMSYFRRLRGDFQDWFPEYEVPGNIYSGTLDMTYFSLLPPLLKERGLKIALVFVYERFQFEVWLSGRNREIQQEISRLIRQAGWQTYHLTSSPEKADSVLDHVLAAEPDFSDLAALTECIIQGTANFIRDVEGFLASQPG